MAEWRKEENEWWYYTGGYRTKGESRICECCGKEFGFKKRSVKTTGQFCSRDCANKSYKPGRHLRGEAHPNWNGGKHIDKEGYIWIRVNEEGYSNGYKLEHRHVMEQHLGRSLDPKETVHHINGIKDDNRIENLQLFSSRHTKGISMCCKDCGSINLIPIDVSAQQLSQ